MEHVELDESIAMRYQGLLSPEQIRLVQLIKREHQALWHKEEKHSDWVQSILTEERLRELQIESGVLPPVS